MIRRQAIPTPNNQSAMYILHSFNRTLRERFESRQSCGPYYCIRRCAATRTRIGMYQGAGMLPGDGPVRLRLLWADDIVNLQHTGWYSDSEGYGDTIRGIVARLPRSRGYLAGWSMGQNMCMELECTIYDNERDAAYAADGMAERAAQVEREHQYVSDLQNDIDMLLTDIQAYRDDYAALALEYRQARTVASDYPLLCREIVSKLQRLRARVSDSVRQIKEKRTELALY